jgi:hypothetical protein
MADIRPTPEQRPIAGGLARLIESADKFARKPFGYENPPAAMVSDFLSIPPLYRTLENYAYGSPLASGTSSVSRYLPKLTADTKGAIEGALNVAPLASPVVRGTRMATTALGRAGERLAERTVPSVMERGGVGADLLSTLALGTTSNVIKPKGGNWLTGDIEQSLKPLRSRVIGEEPAERLKKLEDYFADQRAKGVALDYSVMDRERARMAPDVAINRWIDTKLNKYIRNEMATPEDPVRALAEQGITHLPFDVNDRLETMLTGRLGLDRMKAGFPVRGMGETPTAKVWELATDTSIKPRTAGEQLRAEYPYNAETMPWLEKLDPETPVYSMLGARSDDLGFSHLIDELKTAMSPTSDLPMNLRFDPKDIDKLTVPQAVERVSKINAWRAEQAVKAEREGMMANLKAEPRLADESLQLSFVEKPGGAWVDIPETVNKEGVQLCTSIGKAGGWCTMHDERALDYGSGENRLTALLDAEGRPHAQAKITENEWPVSGEGFAQLDSGTKAQYGQYVREWRQRNPEIEELTDEDVIQALKEAGVRGPLPDITELKPPGNSFGSKRSQEYIKRDPEYRQKVANSVLNFLNSGEWGHVSDLDHYNIIDLQSPSNVKNALADNLLYDLDFQRADKFNAAFEANPNAPRFMTQEQFRDFLGDLGPTGFAKGGYVQGYGVGGAVKSFAKLVRSYLAGEGKAATAVAEAAPKEQKMLMGVYRGYAGEPGGEEALFASPQKSIADYYARRRAAETGQTPHAEMLLVDPFAGDQYGLSILLDRYNRDPNFTRARKLRPEDVVERTQLYAKGGAVDYDPDEIAQLAASIAEGLAPYGVRHSGEGVKGKGYFGPMAGRDGVVTEMSAEDESGEYPLVVPTLTAEELDSLIAGEPISEEIQSKARSWADTRRARGQSPFADPTELRMPRPGYAAGGIAMQVGGLAGGISSAMKLIKKLASGVKKAEKDGDIEEALNQREQLNEAIKFAVNSPEMPRAKPLTKAEIDAYAERMAPQIAGELTRGVGAKTMAGKSQKQFKREQTLPVDRKVLPGAVDPSAPLPYMTLEDQKGSVLLGLPGDPTLARVSLSGIDDVPFAQAVTQHGGPRYGDDEKLWASNLSAATNLLNAADRASKQYGNAPVIASYMKMPTGFGFAQHYLETLLQYQRPDLLNKAAREALEKDIKEGFVKDGKRIAFPNFPGFDDLGAVAQAAESDSNLRKHIAAKLGTSEKYGLRPAADVQFAVSHPELTNLETGASGFTLGEIHAKPLALSSHPTYEWDILGKVLGQMQYSTPYDLLYRDQLDLIRRNPKSPEFNTLKGLGARQKIDEQLVNEVNEYQERLRQLIGKYEGGIYNAEDSVGMQVGGGVSSLIKMMRRLSSEGNKAEKATDLTELVAKLPKASPEVEARVQAEIAAREKARREMYDVPQVDKTKGKAALQEIKGQLRESGKQKFLEPSAVKERMYHGTRHYKPGTINFDPDARPSGEGIKEFQKSRRGMTFVSPDTEFANTYAGDPKDAIFKSGAVYPVHVQVRNPFDFQNADHLDVLTDELSKLSGTSPDVPGWIHAGPETIRKELRSGSWAAIEDPYVMDAAKSLGFDGMYMNEQGMKNLGVFDPKRIKSAIGNRGTYDITDPDITKRRGGVIKKAKGGVVDYDPAEIDTLVSQLKEEFHG